MSPANEPVSRPAGVGQWPEASPSVQAPAGAGGRRHRIAVLTGAAVLGAALGAGVVALAAPWHAAQRSRPARLEQAIVDRQARLFGGLAFSPDGMLLAVTGWRSTALCNLADGQRTVFGHLPGPPVYGPAFSPDGRTLAVATRSNGRNDISRWDLRTGKPEAFLPQPRLGGFSSVAYSPDGTILAAESADHGKSGTSTYLWSVASRRVLAILSYPNGGVSPLAFSPDGRTLAIADEDNGVGKGYGQIHLWNLAARRNRAALAGPSGPGIVSIAYSPDGRTLAATDGIKIYLWHPATRTLATTITRPSRHLGLGTLAFSPAGRFIAATGNGTSAYVWDTATGKLAAVFRDPSGIQTSSLAYSPDGRTLAVIDTWGHIYLWNVSGLP